ncbi:MAG: PD-(D/E)XK nuclease family protein, partial [Bacilli bacterium]|nr:PD-(D/E)XK nuclease family protein [Bacilli bacterium]
EELVRLGANPSYVKTMLDRRLKLNFLRFQNIAFLARPLRHLDESLYDSQFVKELKLKPIKTEMGVAGVHTAVSSSLRKASAYDAKRVKKTVGEYRSYDHSFKGITTPVLEEGHTYSVTDINRYILCPYAYYMKKVLPRIGNDEHRMWRGTLIHKVLETIYDENFDFDAQFDIAKAGYLKTLKDEGVTYDGKEKLNLALWECGLRIVTQELRSKTGKAKVSENLVEMPIEFTLTDGDHNSYLFHGRIDQILVTYSDVESYYTIIDNKSGSERFSPHALMFGYGIQLPMYQAAIASSFEEKGKFGGFAIQPVFFSSQKQMGTTKKDLDRNLLLGGVALKDDLYQQSLGEFDAEKEKDPRCWDKNTMGFTAIDAEENIIGEVSGLEQYNVQDMLDDAAFGALRTIHAIAERDFRIAPTSDDLAGNQAQLPCRYCDYADVCYRKKSKDTTVYWDEIKEHFKLK